MANIYENQNCGNSRPELIEVLDTLKSQLDILETNSNAILNKVCLIRDFREPATKCDTLKPAPTRGGIVGDFDTLIERLAIINNVVRESGDGLTKFVG